MPDRTRSGDEIRSYLRTQVNNALRRLGMYGGQTSLILLFDALAYAEGIDGQWQNERQTWREKEAFLPTGVSGAMSAAPGHDRDHHAIGSVYAEVAHRFAWLDLDRVPTDAELTQLRTQAPPWSSSDRTLDDVVMAWGAASLSMGTNPLFAQTLLYASADCTAGTFCFHLWNAFDPAHPGQATGVRPQPVLLAARNGQGGQFAKTFAYTPTGQQQAHADRQ